MLHNAPTTNSGYGKFCCEEWGCIEYGHMPEIVIWSCHARCLSPRTYRLPSHRSSVISINGGDSVEAGLVTACQTWTRTGFCYLEFLLIGQCTSTFETEPPWFKPTPMWFLTWVRVCCCRLTRNLLPRNRDGVSCLRLLKILT